MKQLKKPDVGVNETSGLSNNTGSNNTRKTYDLKHMNLRKSVNNNGCDTSDEKDKEGRKLISHKELQHIVEPYQNVNLLDNDGKKKSRVTVLIEIGEYLEKFHDPNGEVYVVIIIKGHREVWPMKAKVFRDWLSHQYFQLAESGTDRSSINDALSTLAAIAKFDSEERHVYRRVAGDIKTIYIDLCDESWRVIEVNARGWQILDKSPVMFIRNKGMTALPVPSEKGCIEQLWNFLNIKEKHRPLILHTW